MHAPIADGRRPRAPSSEHPRSIADADAVLVVAKASTAASLDAERRAGVEAEPAEPQHARAEQHERDVGRRVRLGHEVDRRRPSTSAPASAAKPGRHVHDRAAREVEHAPAAQEAVGVPRPVRQRPVDDEREQHMKSR
jgi:hypothetical protein